MRIFKNKKSSTVNAQNAAGQKQAVPKTRWVAGLLIFVLVATISFVAHIPASWVLKQTIEHNLIPPQIQLNQPQGTLWNGQAQLSLVQQTQTSELGQLHWNLSALSLLSLTIHTELNLQTQRGGLRGELSTGLLTQTQIELEAVQGQIPVNDLKPLLPEAYRNLGDLQGQLTLNEIGLIWNVSGNWFTDVSGSMQFTQLDVMGVTFPQLTLTPSLQDKDIRLETIGSGAGWNLTGQSLVNLTTYQADFKLQADSPDTMPDWTDLMMRRNSPVQASFKQNGRF